MPGELRKKLLDSAYFLINELMIFGFSWLAAMFFSNFDPIISAEGRFILISLLFHFAVGRSVIKESRRRGELP